MKQFASWPVPPALVARLEAAVARDAFAPVADDCDYQAICGPNPAQRAARKKGDPRLAAFY